MKTTTCLCHLVDGDESGHGIKDGLWPSVAPQCYALGHVLALFGYRSIPLVTGFGFHVQGCVLVHTIVCRVLAVLWTPDDGPLSELDDGPQVLAGQSQSLLKQWNGVQLNVNFSVDLGGFVVSSVARPPIEKPIEKEGNS